MHQLSRMSLLVPVFTALQKGVFEIVVEPKGHRARRAIAHHVGDDVGGIGGNAC